MLRKDVIMAALDILQPVTPQDHEHPAHWWNEGLGERIANAQKLWIDKVRAKVIDCTTVEEVREVLRAETIWWPKASENQSENFNWWTNGFGAGIIACFRVNFTTFQQRINAFDADIG